MATLKDLKVKITLDATNFKKGLTDAKKQMTTLKTSVSKASTSMTSAFKATTNTMKTKFTEAANKMKSAFSTAASVTITAFKGIATVVGVVGGALTGLTLVGAKYQEQVNQTSFLIGRLDKDVQQLIKSESAHAQAMGMTSKQYQDGAASMGSFMNSMGLTSAQMQKLLPQMMQLVADGAAFANVSIDDAMAAVSSAAMGNYEALGKLNIEMSDALINSSTYAQNLGKTTQQMTTAEKTQAIYNAMLERGAHLTGFAASEADGFSVKLNLMKTKAFELAGSIGQKLIPTFQPLVEWMIKLIDKAQYVADNFEHAVSVFQQTRENAGSTQEAIQNFFDVLGLPELGDFGIKLLEVKEKLVELKEKFIDAKGEITPLTEKIVILTGAVVGLKAGMVLGNAIMAIYTAGLTAFGIAAGIAEGAAVLLGAAAAALGAPLWVVVAIIGAVIGACVALIASWDDVKAACVILGQKIAEGWEWIKKVTATTVEYMKAQVVNWVQEQIQKFTEMKDGMIKSATESWQGIVACWDATVISTKKFKKDFGDTIDKFVDEVKTSILNGFTKAKDDAVNKFNEIGDGISKAIEKAKKAVSDGVEKIKGFMKFEWSLPKLKLPHFSISGSFSLNPPSAPKFGIDWYSKGGIFTKKSILPGGVGVGDAINGSGSKMEAVLPIDELPRLLGLDKDDNKGVTLQITNFYNNTDQDIETLAEELAFLIQKKRFSIGG